MGGPHALKQETKGPGARVTPPTPTPEPVRGSKTLEEAAQAFTGYLMSSSLVRRKFRIGAKTSGSRSMKIWEAGKRRIQRQNLLPLREGCHVASSHVAACEHPAGVAAAQGWDGAV